MTEVLLAEDDAAIAEPLARALIREGYSCEVVTDGTQALARATDWVWIAGNHDQGRVPWGTAVDEIELGGIVLRHHAHRGETRPELSGHFHPRLRVKARGRLIARPCWVMSKSEAGERKLILPAFGTLTGGMDGVRLRSAAKQVAAQLRFTRAQAIATGEPRGLPVDAVASARLGAIRPMADDVAVADTAGGQHRCIAIDRLVGLAVGDLLVFELDEHLVAVLSGALLENFADGGLGRRPGAHPGQHTANDRGCMENQTGNLGGDVEQAHAGARCVVTHAHQP